MPPYCRWPARACHEWPLGLPGFGSASFFNFQRLTQIWPGPRWSWSSTDLEFQIQILWIQVPADLFVIIVNYYDYRLNSATKNLWVLYHFFLGLTWICEDLDSWRIWTCGAKKPAGFLWVDSQVPAGQAKLVACHMTSTLMRADSTHTAGSAPPTRTDQGITKRVNKILRCHQLGGINSYEAAAAIHNLLPRNSTGATAFKHYLDEIKDNDATWSSGHGMVKG